MKHINTKRSFDIWEKQQNTIALDAQKQQFNNQPPNNQYAQDWEIGFPFGGSVTYILDNNIIIAKYNLTNDEIDVTNFEDLEVDFDFVKENQLTATKWFNDSNHKMITEKTANLMSRLQHGQISKGIQNSTLNEFKNVLNNSRLIWTVTLIGIGEISKAVHSHTGEELDFTDYNSF